MWSSFVNGGERVKKVAGVVIGIGFPFDHELKFKGYIFTMHKEGPDHEF